MLPAHLVPKAQYRLSPSDARSMRKGLVVPAHLVSAEPENARRTGGDLRPRHIAQKCLDGFPDVLIFFCLTGQTEECSEQVNGRLVIVRNGTPWRTLRHLGGPARYMMFQNRPAQSRQRREAQGSRQAWRTGLARKPESPELVRADRAPAAHGTPARRDGGKIVACIEQARAPCLCQDLAL